MLGKPADMGLVNMGGLRNILPKGDITVGAVFEILPFENSLCVLTMKGTDMKRLFKAIASLHGEGVSGIRLEINKKGELLNATIGGKPVVDDQLYTVATIDYLADGNGRMDAFLQAKKGMPGRCYFTRIVFGLCTEANGGRQNHYVEVGRTYNRKISKKENLKI